MNTEQTLEEKVKELVEDRCNDLESFTALDISNAVKQDGFPHVRHREVANIVRELYFRDEFMQDQEYEKTNIVIRLANGSSGVAYLYHHDSVSPDDYDSRSQIAITPTTAPAPAPTPRQTLADAVSRGPRRRSIFDVAASTGRRVSTRPTPATTVPATAQAAPATQVAPTTTDTTPTNGVVRDTTTRTQKADCRLEIPPTWVAELGWRFGDRIAAVRRNGRVFLGRRDVLPANDRLDVMLVGCDGRLRLTKTALDKSGITHGPSRSLRVELLDTGVLVG